MKVLQIGLEWFPEQGGGLDRYYYDCTRYLPAIEIDLQGLVAGSSAIANNTEGRVIGFALPESSIFQRWQGIRQTFQKLSQQHDYDLVVSHFAFYTFPLLNAIASRPLVCHFHGPWALESGVEAQRNIATKVKKWLEKSVYRRSQHSIVLSKTFRDILHQEYQVPLEKIEVIPGGVDIDRFNINLSQSVARSKLNWHQDRQIIFCIRRLAKRMGLENLVTAMVDICALYPNVLLYIAGKGELTDTLQAQIIELKLDNNVKLLGYVPDEDLPLCYRAANFSVVPTIALEGFGLIVIESLAAGTPALGTPIGGIPEILQPFAEDLVLAGYEPQQLATGIIEALSGERKLPTGQACLDYVRANYDWQDISQKIKLVYQKAIEEK